MKTNYDSLMKVNPLLAKNCIEAEALVKTFPKKAAILYKKALNTFLAVICGDNDIAFDRPGDLTLINMIGKAYSYGVISRYEKGVLDDLRYSAYLAENHGAEDKEPDTKELLEKIIAFYVMVMRYYHLESEEYSEDNLPLGKCHMISVKKNFEMDTAYDKVYLASEEDGGFALVAQYVRHRSELADEVFEFLETEDLNKIFSSCKKVLKPEIISHQEGNNIISVKTSVPEGFVSLSFEDFSNLYTEQRVKFIVNLAEVLYKLHTSDKPLSLGGFETEDIWVSYKGLKCVISGLESKIKSCEATEENILNDVKSFALVCATLCPEYEKIPVAGLMIKHVLMGSGKALMDKIYPVLKKEAAHLGMEGVTLKEAQIKPPVDIYENLKEELSEIEGKDYSIEDFNAEEKEEATEDFTEMYSKVFKQMH